MAQSKFNTQYNRIHSEPEFQSGEKLVEPGESLPTRVLVERMMNAGVQNSVMKALEHQFEFGPDETIPEGYIGPGGLYSADIVDVEGLKKWLEAKIRDDQELAKQLAEEAKVKKDADANPDGGNKEPEPVDDQPVG